jgi:hypothetical protein
MKRSYRREDKVQSGRLLISLAFANFVVTSSFHR